jgi:hypothetical protein
MSTLTLDKETFSIEYSQKYRFSYWPFVFVLLPWGF